MNPETTDPGSTVPFRHHGCAGCLDDLVHLALGELPAEKVAAIDAHCATCASCRAERELLAKSAALVAADARSWRRCWRFRKRGSRHCARRRRRTLRWPRASRAAATERPR